MKIRLKRYANFLAAALLGGAFSSLNAASLSISDVPLFLGGNVAPNIMFTADDSGSMQWEFMPNDDMHFTIYVFPHPTSSTYGVGNYSNQVPDFGDNNLHNFFSRSAANNAVFYNPDITYAPWADTTGSIMADANPTNALYNPYDASKGSIDLTSQQTMYALWFWNTWNTSHGSASGNWQDHTFWPITYYNYNGSGSREDRASYTRVQITTTTPGSTTFTSPAGVVRTRDEEIQNFANWFQYYRSRVLMARAGVGQAFTQLSERVRVGFGTINESGVVVTGVKDFTGTDRAAFFDNLYSFGPSGGTPLRDSIEDVGDYYEDTSDSGPWGPKINVGNGVTEQLACRQSYHILMSDGFYNGSDPGFSNVDNQSGPLITGPESQTYQYTPAPPYQDNYSDTLADGAMYYWNRDLRPDLENKVPTNIADPAFWQHVVTFTIGLGVNGTLDQASDFPALEAGTLAWPEAEKGEATAIDDMWHAGINGRGGFFSAADPTTFSESLVAALDSIAERTGSASSVASNSVRLNTETKIYQARFNSADWSGELLAYAIDSNGDFNSPIWEAGSLIPSHSTRKVYTYDETSSAGIAFKWLNLTSAQKTDLKQGDTDTVGEQRLNYIRGDDSQELSNGGSFRNRAKRLGDIVNSDPWFVGTADFGYSDLPAPEGSAYTAFRTSSSYLNRSPILYFGANDGMLHAINAQTGIEKFAYIPSPAFTDLWQLTDPGYAHRFFVDGPVATGDAYINVGAGKEWRTVLIGSMGPGGRTIYALDITEPDSFSETNVLWEFTDPDLGYVLGQPWITRMNNGEWAAVFGNGYNNDSHKAMLFIVNLEDGSLIKKIDTNVGDSSTPNGLSPAMAIDLNNDRITDQIYAGDLYGNMWRFDVSDSKISKWGSKFKSGGQPAPLFTAEKSGIVQPITIRPEVGRHKEGGVMVYFGTGKYFEVGDNQLSTPPKEQAFYAIWDNDSPVSSRSKLQEQEIREEKVGGLFYIRTSTATEVDWTTKEGWFMDLISPLSGAEGERVVSTPLLRGDRIIFVTSIPNAHPCEYGGTGWIMELVALTGTNLIDETPWDINGDGKFDENDYVTDSTDVDGDGDTTEKIPVSGKRSEVGLIKTPGIIYTDQREYKFTSGSSGGIEKTVESSSIKPGRQSWRQIR